MISAASVLAALAVAFLLQLQDASANLCKPAALKEQGTTCFAQGAEHGSVILQATAATGLLQKQQGQLQQQRNHQQHQQQGGGPGIKLDLLEAQLGKEKAWINEAAVRVTKVSEELNKTFQMSHMYTQESNIAIMVDLPTKSWQLLFGGLLLLFVAAAGCWLVTRFCGGGELLTHLPTIVFSSQGVFLWCVSYEGYVPLLPYYEREFHFGVEGMGILSACLQVGWFVGLPLHPWLLKGIGIRNVILFSLTSYVAASLVFAVSNTLAGLVVARVFEGIGISLLMPTVDAYITRKIPESIRGRAFGVRSCIGILGKSFGLMASFVLYPVGQTFAVMMGITFVGCLVLVANLAMLPRDWLDKDKEDGTLQTSDNNNNNNNVLKRFREVLAGGNIKALLMLNFMNYINVGIISLVVPLYLARGLDFSMPTVSEMWFVVGLLQIPASWIGGVIGDTFNPRTVVLSVNILQGLTLIFLARPGVDQVSLFGEPHSLFVVVFILWMGICRAGIPVFSKLATMVEARNGKAYDELWVCINFSCALGLVIGGLVAGFFYEGMGFHLITFLSALVPIIATFSIGYLTHGTMELE